MKKYLTALLLVSLMASNAIYAKHERKESKSRFSFNLYIGGHSLFEERERRRPVVVVERYRPAERVIVIDRYDRWRDRDRDVYIIERDPYEEYFGRYF